MLTIKAISVGYRALEVLSTDHKGSIHSLFSNAINLSTCNQQLITILFQDKHPQGILLSKHMAPLSQLKQGSSFCYREGDLYIGDSIKLLLSVGQLYRPENRHPWPSDTRALSKNLSLLGKILKEQELLLKRNQIGLPHFFDKIDHLYHIIHQEIEAHLLTPLLLDYMDSFIGFGPGLTPLGDDVITGLLLTFYFYRKKLAHALSFDLLGECIEKASTTYFGKRQLLFALKGYTYQRIYELVKEIPYQPLSSQESIQSVLAIGSTSGYGFLLGIYLGFTILWKAEKLWA